MNHRFTALILSKKGFGEGNLILNVLDQEHGKRKIVSFGGALETGSRRSALISGTLIEGLLITSSSSPRLSEALVLESYEYLRSELKSMAFFLFLLEILDLILPEEMPLESFPYLLQALQLFDSSGDEKFVLFYLLRFLNEEGWLSIPVINTLSPPATRFLQDACTHAPIFLHGKNISDPKKQEILSLCAQTVRKVSGKQVKSLELIPKY